MNITSSIKKHFNNTFLIYALVFLTPLIFVTNTQELYEFPKMYFVYIAGATYIMMWLSQKLLGEQKIRRPGWVVTAFLVFNVISTMFSSHIYTSLWGYYSRFNGGLFSILIFFGIYLGVKNTKNFDRNEVFQLIGVTLIPIGIYAIFQHFVQHEVRAYSTLGQANWLAAYVAMTIPLVLTQYFKKGNQFAWLIIYTLGFTALWFSYSLSGILGIIIATTYWVYLNFEQIKIQKNKVTLLTCITILICILNMGIYKQRINDLLIDSQKLISYRTIVYAQELEQKTSSQAYALSDTGSIRENLAKGTLNLIFSSPKIILFGTGPETFPYEFTKFRPKELNFSSEWDFIFNKPHNYYLELWSDRGVFTLATYIAIIAFTISKRDKTLSPAFIGLYITSFFGWPTVATTLLFWVFLGIIEDN